MKLKVLLAILLPGLMLLLYLVYPVLTQPLKFPAEVTPAVEKVSNPLPIEPITIRPKLIGPGDEVTIVGGFPNQAQYKIYVVNDSERYLVGKAGFNGGMMWNGVVRRTMLTLDGEEVNLPKDTYHFLVETDSRKWEGGQINLVSETVPIPFGAEIRMSAAMQEKVGFELLSLRLKKYKDKTIPEQSRLQGYKIDLNDINLISGEFSPLIFQIRYSVLPAIPNSDWNITQPFKDGWLSQVTYMTVVADNGQFKINGVSEYPPPKTQSEMVAPSITSEVTDPSYIALDLMRDYFNHYKTDIIPEEQRLLDYKLNEIRVISESAYSFTFYLDYTVQSASSSVFWVAGNGVPKSNGVVEHKVWFVHVAKEGNRYTMIGAGTSP